MTFITVNVEVLSSKAYQFKHRDIHVSQYGSKSADTF